MGILLLRLSGALQSWGDSSRFTVRTTRREPTKSGVIGLLAAAMGRSRGDDISDLCELEFAVRTDQPGELIRDFQTERSLDGKTVMPLSQRYYLSDAVFVVALGGDERFLSEIRTAVMHPRWPLYLGRRSCPADFPLLLADDDETYVDVRNALGRVPWQAAAWYQKRCLNWDSLDAYPDLEIACDGREGEPCEAQADVPLSFGKVRRYTSRAVFRYWISNPNAPQTEKAAGAASVPGDTSVFGSHDPMSFF